MSLDPRHRRHLWLDQGVVGFVLNLLINYGIARLIFGKLDVVPVTGDPSMVNDTIATAFILPYLLCWIVTWVVRVQVREGKLPVAEWERSERRLVAWLPARTGWRALALGLAGAVLLGVPLAVGLGVLFPEGLATGPWCWWKGGIAGGIAVVVGPLVALGALGDSGSGR